MQSISQMQSNTFCFIPPYGGLWESAVKTAKHHLKRVAGNALFPFEEMQTLLTQIEACLNSRPLAPLSSDPNDPNPWPFSHWSSLERDPEPRHNLHHHQQIVLVATSLAGTATLLERWSKEYLGHLQHRRKWKRSTSDVTINDLVIIRGDNIPPVTWRIHDWQLRVN
jgi:hypothetical protein